MKTLIIVILIFPVFFSCSNSQDCSFIKTHTTLEELNLNGPVSSLNEFSYKAIDSSGLIIKGRSERGYGLYENTINGSIYTNDKKLIFNKSGNIEELIQLDRLGNVESKKEYIYDDTDYLVEEFLEDSEGKIKSTTKYSNNELGQVVLIEFYKSNNTLEETYEFKYDCENQTTEVDWKMPNGNSRMKVSDYYNSDGLISKTAISIMGHKNSEDEFEYNSNQLIIKKSSKHPNSIATHEYQYDSLRNVISRIDNMPIESTCGNWSFSYSYDDNRNWIKRISYKDSVPMYIIERIINYK